MLKIQRLETKAALIYLPSLVDGPNGNVGAMSYHAHPASWPSQISGYMLVSGRQLRTGQPYENYRHNAAHELGHAMGLMHERSSFPQTRPMNHLMKEGGGNLCFYLIEDAKRLDHADLIKTKTTYLTYIKCLNP